MTGGQSLHAAWQLLCQEPCRPFGLSAWIVVFSGVQLILSQVTLPVGLMSSMQTRQSHGLAFESADYPSYTTVAAFVG